MNRFLPVLALAAMLTLPASMHAQVRPGLHVARATDSFDGVTGVGASLRLGLPILPVGILVAGEYFFPGCDGCRFWGGSLDAQVSLPVLLVTPYGTAGLVLRNQDVGDTRVRSGGFGVGAGVNLNALAIGAYAEGRYEFLDGGEDQFLLRLGLRI